MRHIKEGLIIVSLLSAGVAMTLTQHEFVGILLILAAVILDIAFI